MKKNNDHNQGQADFLQLTWINREVSLQVKTPEDRAGSLSLELYCCVPGTAHVLKGEFSIGFRFMLGKSQTQPDGGEGCSVIATVIR